MPDIIKGVLDDARKQLTVNDLSGGLVTNVGALSLGPNQTPDCLNVIGYKGELLFRGGYSEFSTLADVADADQTYYDANQVKHMLVWNGGNIHDVASGSPVLVAAAVYTAGEQIAKSQLNGVLYWATLTVPLRQYDGTTEQAVTGSGDPGTVDPPACNWLVTYAGSLVAIAPVPAGIPAPSSFMWSDVNAPDTWIATNIQTVGSNDGSVCSFALLMGILPGGVANTGIPATRQLLIGKNKDNLFIYQGALGSMTENAIACPVGAIDPNSAVYIPTKEGLGMVVFLGSDGQFWATNGAQAIVISINILNLVYTMTQNAVINDPDQKFFAAYNDRFQYYICDFGGGTQIVYKWDTDSWWLFRGWPSGPYMIAATTAGLPSLYCAGALEGGKGVWQLGIDFQDDNGSDITAHYTTPYIHGGKPERQKYFQWFNLFTYNVGTKYTVTGVGMPNADNTVQEIEELVLQDPEYGAPPDPTDVGIWDVSLWDECVWGGGGEVTPQPYAPASMKGRCVVLSQGNEYVPAGEPMPLKSGAAQFTISWTGGVSDFRVLGYSIGFIYRGTGFVGNKDFQTKGNITTAVNKFTNTGDST